ncbi:P-loop containing nucleoside triphosphate hydrolase protein [Atractiella rhizophila]|nr:P-loop containing nucleoside triphosphate hydrolase protein [Atractiella rhizophila]
MKKSNSLQWKPVTVAFDDSDPNFTFDFDEISDVEVEWETFDSGAKRAKLKPKGSRTISGDLKPSEHVSGTAEIGEDEAGASKKGKKRKRVKNKDGEEGPGGKSKKQKVDKSTSEPSISPTEEIPLGSLSPLESWPELPTHLHSAISKLSFTQPTLIQSSLVSHLPLKHDVIATSPTGSGKTFAYMLPILFHLFSSEPEDPERSLALIITPTRELAIQVTDSMQRVFDACTPSSKGHKKIVTVTGGLAIQKQTRLINAQLLGKKEGILVATPGRLSEMLEELDGLEERLQKTRFLVLDEADKLVEKGKFEELERILPIFQRKEDEEDEEAIGREDDGLRTLVLSATMEKGLMGKLGKKKFKRSTGSTTLEDLLSKVDFRDDKPLIIQCQGDMDPRGEATNNDASTKKLLDTSAEPAFGLPRGLRHTKLECIASQKDLFLYYFLLRYPGRSLIFLTSIDSIRRLHPLLTLLRLSTTTIHSSMKQPMRLKSLEAFKKNSHSVLLATDVAARGLDIQGVDHVIHYQVPRTTESYVHRSGRTARAGKEGVSLLMVGPEEKGAARELERGLGGDNKWTWDELTPEWGVLEGLKERLEVAKKVEELERGAKKEKVEESWEKKLKKDLELGGSSEDEEEDEESTRKRKRPKREKAGRELATMRHELKVLLDRPLKVRGTSLKYITGSGSKVLDQMLENKNLDGFVGVAKSSVLQDLKKA